MYHPTTRLLTILELLQTYSTLSGAELARRLEVEPRSVRRYIQMLQDMGIPIEATKGPGGGYQLRPGYKLPPLMFNDAEATAVVLGLLSSIGQPTSNSSIEIEGALAKILRVLPLSTRSRLDAIAEHLILSPYDQDTRPDTALLLTISDAIQRRKRLAIAYVAQHSQATYRTIEPYNIANWWGNWYVVAYCCLRKSYRLFRLDRMDQVELRAESFERNTEFDAQEYMVQQLTGGERMEQIAVEFLAPRSLVESKVPASFGSFAPTERGVLFRSQYGEVNSIARYLFNLNIPFEVHENEALRGALQLLADQILQSIKRPLVGY